MQNSIKGLIGSKEEVTRLFSMGQAGFIIKSKMGKLLGVDLYLSDCVERVEGNIGFKRLLPKILAPSEIILDCIIATHPHYDHFDYDSMPSLLASGKTKLFASLECRKEMTTLGIEKKPVVYVSPQDSFTVDGFHFHFIHCDHGAEAPDAVGVIICVDGKNILMVGDTSLRLDWRDEYLSKGPIDILIAPINGKFGNLNAEECAKLADILKPALLIPCHYGMCALHGGDPGAFYELMKNKYPDRNFMFLSMGESIVI